MVRVLISCITLLLTAQTGRQRPGPAVIAKIHGRITENETGKPVAKLRVGLVRKSYSRDGALELTRYQSAETEENGDYTILCTVPGRYYVATAAETADGLVFIPRYFPAAPEISSAAAMNLANGMELNDVNIAIAHGKRVSVRGRLLDGLGRRLPHVDWVWLVPRDAMLQSAGQAPVQGRGGWQSGYKNASRYEISGVLPGHYDLMSWRFDDIQDREESVVPIEVGDSDLEVDVVSYKGYRLNGRFRFEGGSSFSLLQRNARGPVLQLFARAVDESPVISPGATLSNGGLFSFAPLTSWTSRVINGTVHVGFKTQQVKAFDLQPRPLI